MPLFDNILGPYQEESKAIEARTVRDPPGPAAGSSRTCSRHRDRFAQVPWLLAGAGRGRRPGLAARLCAGWVSNRVSERISVDLRNTTYAHLVRLSLEFFGDKRTGDLISRISSDTDRICSFLSDTVVDFITDCLTIVGHRRHPHHDRPAAGDHDVLHVSA